MAVYKVYAFDGIEISALNARGNMGTGAADTAFIRISDGYFDAYGSRRAPQGIRPITASGWVHQAVGADRVAKLDELRHRLGERGKLTLAMADDSLRWQWARLVDVDIPADYENVTVFPFNLSWVTADQIWYGVVVSPEEWTWGDLSWTFGDGTAEMGEAGTTETLTASTGSPQAFLINNPGSIAATNLALVVTAGSSAIFVGEILNFDTKEFTAFDFTLTSGQQAVIHSGERSVWFRGVELAVTSAFNLNGKTATIVTSPAHGLTNGMTVEITGTHWAGIHEDITIVDTLTFTFSSSIMGAQINTGTCRQLVAEYANFHNAVYPSKWPTLAPGDNTIQVDITGNTSQDATISWEYYEHYA